MKTDLTTSLNGRLKIAMLTAAVLLSTTQIFAQNQSVIDAIVKEETTNSQLQPLAHELFDGVGPRLVGTPQMKKASDWAIEKYKSWDIPAHAENWGVWRGW